MLVQGQHLELTGAVLRRSLAVGLVLARGHWLAWGLMGVDLASWAGGQMQVAGWAGGQAPAATPSISLRVWRQAPACEHSLTCIRCGQCSMLDIVAQAALLPDAGTAETVRAGQNAGVTG